MFDVLASNTKWRILELLAERDRTPSEIAALLKTSLPNITQQLKVLEKNKLVFGVEKEKTKKAGRPFKKYSLGKGFVLLAAAIPGEAKKLWLEVDSDLELHLRIWSIPQREFHRYVERFWWEIQDNLTDIEAIAVFGSVARGNARTVSDIDMLILAENNVEDLEKKLGVKLVGSPGKSRMFMAQIFSKEEFRRSLASKSQFAREVIENIIIIYDPHDTLKRLRNEFKAATG